MNQELLEKVNKRIDQILPKIIGIRRQLHSDPEIGLETFRTKDKIRSALGNTGLSEVPSFIGADYVGEITGKSDYKICLRADTDGLPISETTNLAYSSKTPHSMHACGHDGHTAILIGAIMVLDYLQEYLRPTVRFIFQPGEEVVCGGKKLVAAGGCAGIKAAYALHGWPGLPVGRISTKPGVLFAAGFTFRIELFGKEAHGAMPEQGNNPIPVAGLIINQLVKAHEKENKANGGVISVCALNAGQSSTIITERAVIKGTVRYLTPQTGQRIKAEIIKIVRSIANDHEIHAEMDFDHGYSEPVNNSESGFKRISTLAQDYLPAGAWGKAPAPTMVCEDFAYYLTTSDGGLFLLGLGEDSPKLHSSNFDFNDAALKNGMLLMSLIALSYE